MMTEYYFTRFDVPLHENDIGTLAKAQEAATKRAMETGLAVVVYRATPVGVVEPLAIPVEWRDL